MIRPVLLICFASFIAAGGCGDGGYAGSVEGVFGGTGLGPGEFSYPRAIAIAPDGAVFVADKSGRIQRFDRKGLHQTSWHMPEYQAGKPTGMTVDLRGRLFVADTHYHRVLVFDRDGNKLMQLGTYGKGDGQFIFPTDVAVDRDGFIYVSEYGGNDRISKFTPSGEFARSFGGPDAGDASLRRPSGLAIDEEQTIWGADAGNHRICRFDRNGRLLAVFGRLGRNAGQLRYPYDVAVCPDGTLLVCEYGNNRLQWFTPGGQALGTWGVPGRQPGELAHPWGAQIGYRNRIYVVDSGNNRIQIVAG